VIIYLNICSRVPFNFKKCQIFLTLELSIPGNGTSILKNKPQSGGKISKIAHKEVMKV
jgi:hypothetical protein